MKKLILLTGIFVLAGFGALLAQPTFSIPCSIKGSENGQVCLPVRVKDFSDILSTDYSIRWDQRVLRFTGVQNFNPEVTGLDESDFDLTNTDNGVLTLQWDNGTDCANNNSVGVLIEDNGELVQIYELCFDVIGTFGEFTDVRFDTDPVDKLITRERGGCTDIGWVTEDGCVSVEVDPVRLNVASISGKKGETVCVEVAAENFVEIVSLGFTLEWDHTKLRFIESNSSLPPLFNTNPNVGDGELVAIWENSSGGCSVLPDGANLVSFCFEVIGEGGESSPVRITSGKTALEVVECGVNDIGVIVTDGEVSIQDADPNGLTIIAESNTVNPGEDFCVDLTVRDFDNLRRMNFSLNWNSGILGFSDFTVNPATNFFPILNVDDSRSASGSLAISWEGSAPKSLPDNTVLMTVCFRARRSGVSNISFTSNPEEIDIRKNTITTRVGLNNENGLITVRSFEGVTLIAPNRSVDPGEEICVPIRVSNFNDIVEMDATFGWENGDLRFERLQGFNLPGLSAANFDLSSTNFGFICFDWESANGNGVSLANNEPLFEVCYTAEERPLNCSPITFDALPCAPKVVSEQSNGMNIGVVAQNGEVCINNPFEFHIEVKEGNANTGQEVCVDVEVDNFLNVKDLEFSINWDPTKLFYTDIEGTGQLVNFSSASYDDTQASMGSLAIDYESSRSTGETLPNGTSIVRLCFIVRTTDGECGNINITNNPQPLRVLVSSSGGDQEIAATSENGRACSPEGINISERNITGVDCPGNLTGAIDIAVVGGSGNYEFRWENSFGSVVSTSEDLSNATNGVYTILITDAGGNDTYTEEFTIPLLPNALVADAGGDVILPCESLSMELDGSASLSVNGAITYLWEPIGGGAVFEGADQAVATIFGAGDYRLCVSDNSCTACDTITVLNAEKPAAEILDPELFTCAEDYVELRGSASFQDDIAYEWIASNGGALRPGTENNENAEAIAPGDYILRVTNTQSGCSDESAVMTVRDGREFPTAVAGDDLMVDCNNATATLSAMGSDMGDNFTYLWTNPSGDSISAQNEVDVTEIGVYTLRVTNETNGCISTDEVELLGDTQLPVAKAGPSQTLTCTAEVVTLDGSESSKDGFSYLWSSGCGTGIVGPADEISVQVNSPCVYTLRVTNDETGCFSFSTVEVKPNKTLPQANAGDDFEITCLQDEFQLTGTSNPTNNVTVEWTALGGSPITAPTTKTPMISAPDTYVFTVTNDATGCTKTDTIVVLPGTDFPVASVQEPSMLTCDNEQITLNTAGSSTGDNLEYVWDVPLCSDDLTGDSPTVECPGVYALMIRNTDTGCESPLQSVEVRQDIAEPTVNPGENQMITCLEDTVRLDASASTQGDNFTFTWTAIRGAFVAGTETSLTPMVNEPGTYGLEITNTITGCKDSEAVFVTDGRVPPIIDAGSEVDLSCEQNSIQLNGSTDDVGLTFNWTALNGGIIADGENSNLNPTILEPGLYILTAMSAETGCSARDSVRVGFAGERPTAQVVGEVNLDCGSTSVQLDGAGSATGENITYAWTSTDGNILSGASTLVPEVDRPGTYRLTVSDATTNCSASAEVLVTQVVNLPDASASIDGDDCSTTVTLLGNQPEGATGVWTSATGATIATSDGAITDASNLSSGTNSFTWTLSATGCENYSAQTVEITLQDVPNAQNDQFALREDEFEAELQVLQNDRFDRDLPFTWNIISEPSLGAVSNVNPDGSFTYIRQPFGLEATVQLDYELCSSICASACDTAFIQISVPAVDSIANGTANAISPNGDGINDELIFDEIASQPDQYPNSRLIVFNRWGDVIFEQSPYNNDWQGTNQNGKALPHGTYYYIMRLDITTGQILRGDVTIIK